MPAKSFALLAIAIGLLVTVPVHANHAWSSYHWARTANPFTLQLGDNVSSAWDASLALSSADWSISGVLDTEVVAGATNPKTCKPILGRVEVCNSKYGANGWLGIASIWISGSHITQGTVKMNDTYFQTAKYDTDAWRNLVMCQEIGHTLGLDHQDEDFENGSLGTCMDYSNDAEPNQHPNAHDYQMLEEIYGHLDSTTTVGVAPPSPSPRGKGKKGIDQDDPSAWGRAIKHSVDGRASLYVKDLGNGNKVFTHVFWAEQR
ncbi:MAG TPA: hypothetical protein VFY28_01365 [Candidatus Paceibacterota bacterium]|nr:hypothetical protein [Candidatus Paceibacterota bacterium]